MKKRIINAQKEMHQFKYEICVMIALIALVLLNYVKLKAINFDQLMFYHDKFSVALAHAFNFIIQQQARPSFMGVLLTAVEAIAGRDGYFIYAILFITAASVVCGLIVKELTQRRIAFFITALACLVYFPITLEPIAIPTAYAMSLGFGVVCVLSSILCILKADRAEKRSLRIMAYIFATVACFTYEVGVLYLPVLFAVELLHMKQFDLKSIVKKAIPVIVIGFAYLIAYVLVKTVYVGSYEGVAISDELDLIQSAWTYLQIFITNIPGFFFFHTSNAYQPPAYYFQDTSSAYGSIRFAAWNWIHLAVVLQIICFVFLCWRSLKRLNDSGDELSSVKIGNKLKKVLLALISIYCICIPIMPSVLTQYTINQVKNHWRLLQASSPYSFFFLIMAVSWALCTWMSVKRVNRILLIVLCTICSLQFALTSFSNYVNVDIIHKLSARFSYFDQVAPDLAKIIPDGAAVYSPSLYVSGSIPSVPSGYYQKVIDELTGKTIVFVNDTNELSDDTAIFYLRYATSEDYGDTIFSLCKTDLDSLILYENKKALGSNATILAEEMYLFCASKSQRYNVLGIATGEIPSEVVVETQNADETILAQGKAFLFPIVKSTEQFGEMQKFKISNQTISADSLCIVPYYHVMSFGIGYNVSLTDLSIGYTMSTANILYGYYQDGWAERDCKYELFTNEEGVLEFDFYIPDMSIVDENSKIQITINGEHQAEVPVTEESFSTSVTFAPNTKAEVYLESNFEFQSPDGRTISYILNCTGN